MFIQDILGKSALAVAAIQAAQAPSVDSDVAADLLSWSTASSPSKYAAPGRKVCELHALGHEKDDAPNFLKAVDECGKGGVIYMPDSNYTIAQPLWINLEGSVLDLHGFMSFTQDVDYWVHNSIKLGFQNQSLAWVVTGRDYVLDGNDKGGIHGGGGIWYSTFNSTSNAPGRPMSLTIGHSTNVVVKNWSVLQPAFWATLVWDSKDVLFKDVYVNATREDDEGYEPTPLGWVQNTDGSDTYRSHNVTYENFVYQGGDDCLAFKANSSSITVRNVTCYGGTGVAFGSVGQYEGVADLLEDIYVEDVKFYPSNQVLVQQGIYFKSWIGSRVGWPPNGGGGGTGWTKNVTVKDVYMEDVLRPIAVTSTIVYIQGDDAVNRTKFENTGTYEWKDITIKNVTGTSRGNRIFWATCSKLAPCHDWKVEDLHLTPGKTDHPEIGYVCNNFVLGPRDGLNDCHPSDSDLETDSGGSV